MSLAILAAAVALSCPDVLDYTSWREAPGQVWDFKSPQLTIVGAEHSRDPSHAQFDRIAAAFAEAKPTLVFFEGPDRGTRGDAGTAIRETGESGFARFLASRANVAVRGLEPSPVEQIRTLLKQYPMDQVQLFFVLREGTRLRDRENLEGAALDAGMGKMLEKIAPMESALGTPLAFKDVAGLQAAFARYWPRRDWKTAESGWFSPLADDSATGGVFTGAINRADSSNRNRHMVKLLSEAVGAVQRPFVVIGRNHVPMIAPALKCALEATGSQ